MPKIPHHKPPSQPTPSPIDLVDHGEGHAHLLVRRNRRTGELAYYLTWTATPVALQTLVTVAGMRWRIEETFQGAKELAGLDEHQVRTWTSWHRWVTSRCSPMHSSLSPAPEKPT